MDGRSSLFKRWIKRIDRSGLEPTKRVGRLRLRHLTMTLTFYRYQHRITNDIAKGLPART